LVTNPTGTYDYRETNVTTKTLSPTKTKLLRALAPWGAVAATTGLVIGVAAGPASAAWAHNTGDHRVCAASLTLHASNGDYTLGNGTAFAIDHFADSGNHAWGTGNGRYGWVYNGYFC
jgi:hypothetical protein